MKLVGIMVILQRNAAFVYGWYRVWELVELIT
jgi:hypothetical protein